MSTNLRQKLKETHRNDFTTFTTQTNTELSSLKQHQKTLTDELSQMQSAVKKTGTFCEEQKASTEILHETFAGLEAKVLELIIKISEETL